MGTRKHAGKAHRRATEAPSSEPAIRCAYTKLVPISLLKPHPRNPNTHSDEQIALLTKIIAHQGWRSPIVVSELSGFVVAGHARLTAAQKLDIKKVPVDYQSFATDADELAHLVADNKIAELAELSPALLSELVFDLDDAKFDLSLTGFSAKELEQLVTNIGDDAGGATPFTPAQIADALPSHIRMVQLFLTVETFPVLMERVKALQANFKTDNVTDTVFRAVEICYRSHYGKARKAGKTQSEVGLSPEPRRGRAGAKTKARGTK